MSNNFFDTATKLCSKQLCISLLFSGQFINFTHHMNCQVNMSALAFGHSCEIRGWKRFFGMNSKGACLLVSRLYRIKLHRGMDTATDSKSVFFSSSTKILYISGINFWLNNIRSRNLLLSIIKYVIQTWLSY